MSSSPEIEQFEITDDDFASAFNPERKKFRMSKNQAIYGKIMAGAMYAWSGVTHRARLHPGTWYHRPDNRTFTIDPTLSCSQRTCTCRHSAASISSCDRLTVPAVDHSLREQM